MLTADDFITTAHHSILKVDINKFLGRALIPIRIGCLSRTGWPKVVSLWYVYAQGKFFCATQKNAKVVEYLKANPKCGFEVAGDLPPYRGVRGRGEAQLDDERGPEILQSLMTKYLQDQNSELAKFLLNRSHSETAIVIEPKSMFSYDYSGRMKGAILKTVTA